MDRHLAQLASSTGRRRSLSDPLAVALQPPPNESPEQRQIRVQAEEDAKRRSDRIDRMLKDSQKEQQRKKIVKILLLGQSESGKSTTLKRESFDVDDLESTETPFIIISGRPSSAVAGSVPGYDSYRKRLAPLLDVEQRLIQLLSDPEDNDAREATHLPRGQSSQGSSYASAGFSPSSPPTSPPLSASLSASLPSRPAPRITIPQGSHSSQPSPVALSPGHEVAIPPRSNWKKALGVVSRNQSPKSAHTGEIHGWWEDPHDPVHVMNRCAPTMTELWRDPKVRQRLAERRLRLEESSGFYLNEIDRVTAKMFFPTDADVLKARLKTTGVIEHSFTLPKNSEFRGGVEWKIYDVGGARPQRQAWAPYFDDVNAIIFLAPISSFDQVLAEDTRVNRLDDSLQLWQTVVSNPLLKKVNIILFLNKCDLLKRKLESGVRLKHYMTSYRDRPNDYDTVSNYFRLKFGAMHHSYTPNKARECFIHFTSVTDTRNTQTIISNVRDIILTGNLRSSSLM
ncbi:G-protein alpha subunit [Fomitopsis serialis]|uniref:G-protein alpha subunit n=1 Tax=Fomitopsis serialis TaxID=139415 RepID=UPI0020079459|nr:G-protein alpha subunit [Neoantrodia serialis]KAH9936976.1 G-protein alpha subunit [Neoantrodia serialis]